MAHKKRKKKARKGHKTHHSKRHGKRKHAGTASAAHAVKAMADRAAKDMARMAAECKTEIKKVKKQAAALARKAPKRRKKRATKKRAKTHRKKTHHKAHHTKKTHPKRRHAKKVHAHRGPARTHGRGKARAHRFGGGFGRGPAREKTITAATLLAGAKRRGHRGMKTWVCEAPVRTGCGGGARGGHVLGDMSKNTARRLRR